MPDWTKPMQQTYEFYVVDPNTWKDKTPYNNVISCSINRDLSVDTLGSATLDLTEPIDECYMRIYLITIQNGVKEKHPLGVFLVQAPLLSFNGKRSSVTADGYTPLIELKESQPEIGFYISKYTNVMERVSALTKEHVRAPVVTGKYPKTWTYSGDTAYTPTIENKPASDWVTDKTESTHIGDIFVTYTEDLKARVGYIWNYNEVYRKYEWKELSLEYDKENLRLTSDFVAGLEDSWFTYLSDLLASINKRFDLDEMGRICYAPTKDLDLTQPVWTFNDDNSSILNPDVDLDCDLFGIPNVVEVVYSNAGIYSRYVAENHDPNSPLSIERRGRKITHRVTDPGFIGTPTQVDADRQAKNYAKQLLKELSTVERTISYTHGYCPVRLNDCIRLNYTRAGLNNIKARVISQDIKCSTGCSVSEKAVYNTKLINDEYITGEDKEPW